MLEVVDELAELRPVTGGGELRLEVRPDVVVAAEGGRRVLVVERRARLDVLLGAVGLLGDGLLAHVGRAPMSETWRSANSRASHLSFSGFQAAAPTMRRPRTAQTATIM